MYHTLEGCCLCICRHVSEITKHTKVVKGTHLLITCRRKPTWRTNSNREQKKRQEEAISKTKQQLILCFSLIHRAPTTRGTT